MVENTYNYEVAIIFRTEGNSENTYFTPFKVVEGFLDYETGLFIDKKGYGYHHVGNDIISNSFGYRVDIAQLALNHPFKTFDKNKSNLLEYAKQFDYFFDMDEQAESHLFRVNTETGKREKFSDVDADTLNMLNMNAQLILENPEELIEVLESLGINLSAETFSETPALKNEVKTKPKELPAPRNIELNKNEKDFDVIKLRSVLRRKIFGQNDAVDYILAAFWYNYKNAKNIARSKNIFIVGPSGSGKTEIFRIISEESGVPCVIETAKHFTTDGYKGRDVTDMLVDMLVAADGNLEKAQTGILIIDEIDKITSHYETGSEINSVGVQNGLLKIIEGGVFPITYNGNNINFDTNHLTVVSMGAFEDLYKTEIKKTVGFGATNEEKKKEITPNTVIDYGVTKEYMRRCPWFIVLNKLTVDDLVDIMSDSEISSLKEVIDFYESLGIEVQFYQDFIQDAAKKANEYNEGAGGIDKVVTDIFRKTYVDAAFSKNKYKKLVLTKKAVENGEYIFEE